MEIRVLVVEDDEAIRGMLVFFLEEAGFAVACAADSEQALARLAERTPDLILLDWMLPGMSGIEWAGRVKKDPRFQNVPIILVTAKGEESDKIAGFEAGADDIVVKPFSPRELLARMRAVLRRCRRAAARRERLELGGITLNPLEHRVMSRGQELAMSPTEYRLLEFFLCNPDKAYNRAQIVNLVWGRSHFIEERTVDVHIRRLRKILATHGQENIIQTVRGYGYRCSAALPRGLVLGKR